MLCVGCLKWSQSAPVCEFCTSSGTCPKEAPYPMDYGLSCCPSRLRGPKCEGKKEGSLLHITDTKECCPKEPSECPGESSCGPAQDPSRELAKQWHRGPVFLTFLRCRSVPRHSPVPYRPWGLLLLLSCEEGGVHNGGRRLTLGANRSSRVLPWHQGLREAHLHWEG